jgi:hypothetical protein
MSDSRTTLEERARRAILQHALMRWESAGTLAAGFLVTFLLSLFNQNLIGLPNITWLLVGLAGYAGMVYSSMTDQEGNRKVVEGLLHSQFTPKKLRKPALQARIQEALDYRTRINGLINEKSADSALRGHLETMADQFDEWIEEIWLLAQRLDTYELQIPTLKKAYDSAVKRHRELEQRRSQLSDAKVRAEIDQNLAALTRQIETIEALGNTMRRAELRLDNTLTAMGTIYPQTMLLSARDIDSDRYKRLQQEIADEVNGLGDILHAMDEVYSDDGVRME